MTAYQLSYKVIDKYETANRRYTSLDDALQAVKLLAEIHLPVLDVIEFKIEKTP